MLEVAKANVVDATLRRCLDSVGVRSSNLLHTRPIAARAAAFQLPPAAAAIGLDFDWHLVDGGVKRDLFAWRGLDYQQFSARHKAHRQRMRGVEQDAPIDRREQLNFLILELMDDNSGLQNTLSVADMEEYGSRCLQLRPGVLDTLQWAQTTFARLGVRVPLGVFSGFWAPLIRSSPLVREGLIAPEDVYAQEFVVDIDDPHTLLADWSEPLASSDQKPKDFDEFLANHHVSMRKTMVIDDCYSGGPWVEHVSRHGGTAVGVLNSGLPTTEADAARLATYKFNGWLKIVAENDYRVDGEMRRVFETEVLGMAIDALREDRRLADAVKTDEWLLGVAAPRAQHEYLGRFLTAGN